MTGYWLTVEVIRINWNNHRLPSMIIDYFLTCLEHFAAEDFAAVAEGGEHSMRIALGLSH